MTPLTPAQKRALEWLPSDGAWRDHAGEMLADLTDLRRQRPDLVKDNFIAFLMGDEDGWAFFLTVAGIALKAEMEADRG